MVGLRVSVAISSLQLERDPLILLELVKNPASLYSVWRNVRIKQTWALQLRHGAWVRVPTVV